MKRKIWGVLCSCAGVFITLVSLHNHIWWMAGVFGIATALVVYHFFGTEE